MTASIFIFDYGFSILLSQGKITLASHKALIACGIYTATRCSKYDYMEKIKGTGRLGYLCPQGP